MWELIKKINISGSALLPLFGIFDYSCRLHMNLGNLPFNKSCRARLIKLPFCVIIIFYTFYLLQEMHKIMESVVKDTLFFINTDLSHYLSVTQFVLYLE